MSPSRFVSDQIGRFVTERRTPVYPATRNASPPPPAATIAPTTCGGRSERSAGHGSRPESARAPTNESNVNNPKAKSAHEPSDIGDHGLTTGSQRSD